MRASLLATVTLALALVAPAVPAVALTPTAAGADAPARKVVTRAEYRRIKEHMTRERVERIFGAGHGCVHQKGVENGVRYVGRQYRGADGWWVAIQYDTALDGRLRTADNPWGFKQWSTTLVC